MVAYPPRHQKATNILIHCWVRYSILGDILFPKPAPGISPPSTRSAFGSNHLSSGSLITETVQTPLDFPQQTTAAKHALSDTPASWNPFVPIHEITTTYPNPSPPTSYTGTTSPLFPPPNPPLPPTDRFPPPLNILPDGVPFLRHQHPRRPVVCTRDFVRRPEDTMFHSLMNRARAHPEFREPALLKGTFCRRNKGQCPNSTHTSSTCLTILVGPLRNECRTETVALRETHKVLGLCWTCNTW